MRNPLPLLCGLLFILLFAACHRPYALVQRTPSPRLHSPSHTLPTDTSSVAILADKQVIALLKDSTRTIETSPGIAVASASPALAERATGSVGRRIKHMESLLHESKKMVTGQPRPRPKPKNQLRLGNRIRESLGLPLRQELNWWQRIDWKLKSSVFVIGIAIVFAVLGLGQLALIFGLIGALLLVLGLKRSFKKRRPWL